MLSPNWTRDRISASSIRLIYFGMQRRREGGSVPGARLVGATIRSRAGSRATCASARMRRRLPCRTSSCPGGMWNERVLLVAAGLRARGRRIGRRGGAAAAERPGVHPQLSRDRAPWRGDVHAAHALPRRRGSGADAPQRRAPRGLHASVEADVRGPRHHVRRDRGIGSDPSRKRGQARRPVPPSLYVRHHRCAQGRRCTLIGRCSGTAASARPSTASMQRAGSFARRRSTHLYGLYSLHCAWAVGACTVLLAAFKPDELGSLVENLKPTALWTAPAHVAACRGAGCVRAHDWSSLELAIVSGSIAPPSLVRYFAEKLPRCAVTQLWGMTELQAGLYTRPGDPFEMSATSAGRPSPGTEVRVVGGRRAAGARSVALFRLLTRSD